MATLIIPGRSDASLKAQSFQSIRQSLNTRIMHGVDMSASRDAGKLERLEQVPEDAIIELTLDTGEKWYGTMESLRELFAAGASRGESGQEELTIPLAFTPDEQSRGWIGDITFGALRVIGIDLPRLPARLLASQLEKQLEPGPGLYRCSDPNDLQMKATAKDFESGQPILLLLHGTASSTKGSFGELTADGNRETWDELTATYGSGIFAFEHPTLSKSPLENAVELLKKLPKAPKDKPTVLHLLTHSRGGLIGEILARGASHGRDAAFSPEDIRFFENASIGDNRESDLKALAALNKLFRERNIRIGRFVRVACPAAGTTLASGRLDRYLNTVVNLMERIPILGGSLIFDFVSAFLLAAVKSRMDPATLPGLEAQMPGSPLIRMLNNPVLELESELTVIAGAAEGKGFLKYLLAKSTAWYFGEDNDLVVDTRSMSGGARRREPVRRFFQKAPEVSHFRYFANKASREALAAALNGKWDEQRFETITPRFWEEAAALSIEKRDAAEKNRPVVFLLPGIMGSLLEVDGEKIWIDLAAIAKGKMKELDISNPAVRPMGLVAKSYGRLANYLSDTYEVVLYPYDWRKSMLGEAEALAGALEQKLNETEASQQPVCLLAHSMGGLLARTLMGIDKGRLWKRLSQRKGSRLIMMGAPNGGSHSITRLLLGQEKILKLISLLDLQNSKEALLKEIGRYPGLLQLLPIGDGEPDLFEPAGWDAITSLMGDGWTPPSSESLQLAAKWREFLKREAPRLDPEMVLYVAGKAAATPHTIKIEASKVRFLSTSEGDGRAPWATSIPPELKSVTWYMDAEHGEMCCHEEAFPAIKELLLMGYTTQLSQEPPVSRGIALEEIMEEEVAVFPDNEALAAAALGYAPRYVSRPLSKKTKVSVTHGNLAYARYPVAIGHYKDDGIVSAESVLDFHMKGRLMKRYRLGVYPGREETAEVILDAGNDPPGAIIIGMGNFGDLSQGRLSRSVAFAAKELAVKKHEAFQIDKASHGDSEQDVTPPDPPCFSTLLIGSSYGGLTIQHSIRAILSGVQQANQSLRNVGLEDFMIAAVEIIEIYQDRAVQAAHALRRIIKEGRFEEMFVMEDIHLRKVIGGRRRVLDRFDQDWWHRLQVIREGNRLTFTSLTDRARAEESSLSTAYTPIDKIIERAARLDRWNKEDAQTMFELLMPMEFKEYASDRLNILWILDPKTAEYPWELLYDPSRDEQQPAAVRAGMIRQLKTDDYRLNVENTVERTALVIGDPLLNDPRFQQLPGAWEEAKMVGSLLKTGPFQVTQSLQDDDVRVFTVLFKQNYKIIHLAGHGVFNEPKDTDDIAASGMVLENGTLLSPAVINRMRQVPELVFINCCHLGAADAEAEHLANRNKLAANLGTQLIRMGVRAVVAAGWAVNDQAAKTFARVFYTEMLQETPFGEAVRLARLATYMKHPANNTWGAYQCYGDPFYSLLGNAGGGSSKREDYADPAELIIELETISGSVENASTRYVEKLKDKLEETVKRAPLEWFKESEVLEAIANVHAKMGLYEEAIHYYSLLKNLAKAGYSVSTLEQLGNLKARWGVEQFRKGAREEGAATIREAIDLLDWLLQAGETVERYNLLGSAYKRFAIVEETPTARWQAIEKSAGYYRKAYELKGKESGDSAYYSLPNWYLMETLLGKFKSEKNTSSAKKRIDNNKLEEAKKLASQDEDENPSFWSGVIQADLDILDGLIEGALSKGRHEKIQKCYQKAWQRGGDFLKRRTIEEHLDFLISVLTPISAAKQKVEHREAMQLLADQFSELLDTLRATVFVE
ncbi:MAG: CHAT domain-containing protein [Phaeodactylibacter sp.]|nr:CHAT domain-containing protein [Phaeodactylibacter sp.]